MVFRSFVYHGLRRQSVSSRNWIPLGTVQKFRPFICRTIREVQILGYRLTGFDFGRSIVRFKMEYTSLLWRTRLSPSSLSHECYASMESTKKTFCFSIRGMGVCPQSRDQGRRWNSGGRPRPRTCPLSGSGLSFQVLNLSRNRETYGRWMCCHEVRIGKVPCPLYGR